MPTYLTPGVYVEERSSGARPIAGVSTSTAAFVGVAERGPIGRATFVTSFAEFVRRFGGPLLITPNVSEHYLYYAVRHFFEHGGTRCYVVRTAHYNVPSDATTVQAFAATRSFNGTRVNAADGALSTVTNALRIEASSRGTWGQRLTVTVRPTSKFQLSLVGPNIAAGDLTSITIEDNDVVVPGTILHLVHEITGVVATVTPGATPTFTFTSDDLMEGGASSTATIPVGAVVFKPDFSFVSALAGSQIVLTPISTANPPTGQIQLGTVDGLLPGDPGLAPGDTIHFVVTQSIVEVKATERTMVGTTRAMRVILTSADTPSQDLQAFTTNATRVYARDFSVTVSLGNDVLETHPNLSLVASHPTDYVNDRLGEDTGGSQFIAASELSTDTTAQLVTTAGRGQLTGAATDDGLANLSPADFEGSDLAKNGLHALDAVEDASILVIAYSRMVTTAVPLPRDNQRNLTNAAISWVERRRDMVYVVDPPRTPATTPVDDVVTFKGTLSSSYAALYFPWIEATEDLSGRNIIMPAAGAIAGIYARSDGNRGVHKAPAGLDVGRLSSATGMAYQVTRGDNDRVYPLNINAIRNTPEGIVVWGSRTMSADALWQQVSIRRLFIFLERSIQLGTNWVVFEPNDLTLWKTIEKTVRGFLRVQWREGKLVGATEDQAFFVRCNEETNPPEVVDAGMVVTEIGVAPSRPAEFVIFRVFQFAGRES